MDSNLFKEFLGHGFLDEKQRKEWDDLKGEQVVLRVFGSLARQIEGAKESVLRVDFTTDVGRMQGIKLQGVLEGLQIALDIIYEPELMEE